MKKTKIKTETIPMSELEVASLGKGISDSQFEHLAHTSAKKLGLKVDVKVRPKRTVSVLSQNSALKAVMVFPDGGCQILNFEEIFKADEAILLQQSMTLFQCMHDDWKSLS